MGAKHKTLLELFHHQLKDVHFAERHAGKILLKMAKVAASEPLRAALEQRHDERATALERLELVFDLIDKKTHGAPCEAMHGIIEETKALIDETDEGAVLDAALIAAAEAMEHYAIARYVALDRWAVALDLSAAVGHLNTSLTENRQAVERWAALAGSLPTPALPISSLTLKAAALMGIG